MITYKYYDNKKRRLALLAFQSTGEELTVISIACSKKDSFCKKAAREALEKIYSIGEATINGTLVHPVYYTVKIGGNPYRDFITWANTEFYRHAERRGFTVEEILVKPFSKSLLLNRLLHHKL